MRLVAAAIVVGCTAGAALADEVSVPAAPEPLHAQLQPLRFRDLVPSRAMHDGISGRADLCCAVRPDQTLDCALAHETPSGVGFGRAALRMVRGAYLLPEDFAALEAPTETQLHIPVAYVISRPQAVAIAPDADDPSGLCEGGTQVEASEIVVSAVPVLHP